MISTRRFSRSLPPEPSDVRRAALLLARREGWDVLAPLDAGDAPINGRLIVTGPGLGGPCVLRMRAAQEREPVDLGAREDAMSEHVVKVVRRLARARVRGIEWDAVLLQHPEGGRLDRLLKRRDGLRGGEAATVLLGVSEGVAALHRAGWAGPGLSPGGVVLAADGCPALDDLDAVVPLGPDAAVADAEAFYGFARALCLTVIDGAGMVLLSAVERGSVRGAGLVSTKPCWRGCRPNRSFSSRRWAGPGAFPRRGRLNLGGVQRGGQERWSLP